MDVRKATRHARPHTQRLASPAGQSGFPSATRLRLPRRPRRSRACIDCGRPGVLPVFAKTGGSVCERCYERRVELARIVNAIALGYTPEQIVRALVRGWPRRARTEFDQPLSRQEALDQVAILIDRWLA